MKVLLLIPKIFLWACLAVLAFGILSLWVAAEATLKKADKARALELAGYFGKYGRHLLHCSSNLSFGNPASDYCDCGLSGARGAFDELVVLLRRQETHA